MSVLNKIDWKVVASVTVAAYGLALLNKMFPEYGPNGIAAKVSPAKTA